MYVNHKKKNLILDLDNTLLSSVPIEDFAKGKVDPSKINKFDVTRMDDYYLIFHRPYLQKFLDYIFRNYNVSVWSAGTKDYVLFIVKNIILSKPGRKLDYVMFRYHCKISEDIYGNTKDLRLLWDYFRFPGYTETNTFIVDDLEHVWETQRCNTIPIRYFEYSLPHYDKDDILLKLMSVLERSKHNNKHSCLIRNILE